MVDFWAEWCGPCKSLTPILEQLVAQYQGAVRLVKIDTEKNQELAAQFGIRSLPTVFFFHNRDAVDQFMGLQPEAAIKERIDKFVGDPGGDDLEAIKQLFEQGDTESAIGILGQHIQSNPTDQEARLLLLEWLTTLNRMDDAKMIAENLPEEAHSSSQYKAYEAKLEFIDMAGDLPDLSNIQSEVEQNPENLEARLELANRLVAEQRYEEGLDQLIEILRRDRSFQEDAARLTMLKVFELLGGHGELVSRYRSKLGRILN
jgi:putative thioredoxin